MIEAIATQRVIIGSGHPDRMAHLGEKARRDIVEHCNVKDKLAEYEKLWENFIS